MAHMEAMVNALREAIGNRFPRPWLVAISGIPGSGKSTLANMLAHRSERTAVVPMDGYHLPRAVLSADQLERRGAPDTFDAVALRADLIQLREQRQGTFPAFDHAVKDPEPNAIVVPADCSLVVVEGLYLLLRDWRLEALFDFRIFVDCELEVAVGRPAVRHRACGVAITPEAARQRAEGSDAMNARLILADGCRARADFVVPTNATT